MTKRIFDIFISFSMIVVLLPIILLIAFIVRYSIGSPVFFKQIRPGINGKPFEMIKFRSMCDKVDQDGVLLSDEQRLTAVGSKLRSTSLDELPELWNVLKGDMSLVGPRPLLMEYIPLYNQEQQRRHDIRPGISGWAQVNGRNALCWEDKFKLDVWYVDNQSFLLDLKILFLTVKKVLVRDGINAEGEATVSKFTGIKNE